MKRISVFVFVSLNPSFFSNKPSVTTQDKESIEGKMSGKDGLTENACLRWWNNGYNIITHQIINDRTRLDIYILLLTRIRPGITRKDEERKRDERHLLIKQKSMSCSVLEFLSSRLALESPHHNHVLFHYQDKKRDEKTVWNLTFHSLKEQSFPPSHVNNSKIGWWPLSFRHLMRQWFLVSISLLHYRFQC